MPQYFQKPENALKRANEFIDIGKKEAALDVLYDVIKSKKHRNWQKIHEPILRTYLNLCIDLKRSVNAKEGLYQYKLICQLVNIVSLEEVISYFLQQAEKHADDARTQSIELVTVEDLDNVQTPEGILLSSVSSEDAQDRSDRILLTPWVKFLWEAYRNVLELLRNNNRVEKLYHDTAQSAFKFCLKYARRAEFRKLCVLIKNHLDQVLKYQGQPTAINLNSPESLQMHLETRLFQLENAITMELWQEAFRAIEGIHYLMQMSKKPPKPHMMANYFEKVALVFFKAGNKLFHAAALLKLFTLIKEQKKTVTPEELEKIGSKVLLATLSIKISPGRSAMEEYLSYDSHSSEKERRLATLLGLISLPTRKALIQDLESSILPHVTEELKDLYETLEKKFHPLRLCKQVDIVLAKQVENPEHAQYLESLQDISIIRTLKQIGQVYEQVTVKKLLNIIPFADKYRLEKIIVSCVKFDDMQITMNHQLQSVSFGSALVVALKEEVVDGPFVQAMPSEILRSQLTSLSEGLKETSQILRSENIVKDFQQIREQLVAQYLRQERKEHIHLLNRKSIIEARKERIENLRTQQEREEEEKNRAQKNKLRHAEQQRLEVEREKREKERRVQEMKDIKKQQVWDRFESLRGTDVGKRAFKNLSAKEIDEMDPEDIMQRQYEQLDREKREQHLKLRTQEKRVDHLVRAMRQEEIPLLEKHFAEKKIRDQEEWEQEEAERIKDAKRDNELALKTKGRFERMQGNKDIFLDSLFGNRQQDYQKKLDAFEKNLEKVRHERLEARKKQRMAQRRQEYMKERREQKRKEKEERVVREQEAEERKRREEDERRRLEREERQKTNDEVVRKQREKEEEVDRKWKAQQGQQRDEPPQSATPSRDEWRNDDAAPPSSSVGSVAGGKYVPPSKRRVADPPRDAPDGGRWKDGPDDRRDDRRTDRGDDNRDDRGIDRRGDDRGFDRRDDRGFDRRDDRGGGGGFDRRDDRGGGGGGDAWRRGGDDKGGRGFQDRPPMDRDRRDDRQDSPGGGFGGRSGGWRGDSGQSAGGGFDRRDDRGGGGGGFDRRDDRGSGGGGFDRRDDRGSGGGGFDRRDDRGGGGGGYDRRDDRGGGGGGGFDRRDDRGGGGGGGGGGGSWRSGDGGGGRSEGRSWQASRVRSDRDREPERDGPPPQQSESGSWQTVKR